jgi:hypothetical protein
MMLSSPLFLSLSILLYLGYLRGIKCQTNDESENSMIEKLLSPPFLTIESSTATTSPYSPYTCPNEANTIYRKDLQFRGTSLGGWLVLEPWITPSLFYQFLGQDKDHVAIDSYTFCQVLDPKKANEQLNRHWQSWVTETEIAKIAKLGMNIIRIPIADWMFIPYPPFDTGCWDGAIDELERILILCQQYNLEVLLDIHALRDSQVIIIIILTIYIYYYYCISIRMDWIIVEILNIINGCPMIRTGNNNHNHHMIIMVNIVFIIISINIKLDIGIFEEEIGRVITIPYLGHLLILIILIYYIVYKFYH